MFSTGFFAIGENAYSYGSSGFYSLFFDNDKILHLLYDGPEVSAFTGHIHGWHLGKLIRTQSMLDGVVKWALQLLWHFFSLPFFLYDGKENGRMSEGRRKTEI